MMETQKGYVLKLLGFEVCYLPIIVHDWQAE